MPAPGSLNSPELPPSAGKILAFDKAKRGGIAERDRRAHAGGRSTQILHASFRLAVTIRGDRYVGGAEILRAGPSQSPLGSTWISRQVD
jgi:hypothetical protein